MMKYIIVLVVLLSGCTTIKSTDNRVPDNRIEEYRFQKILNCGIRVIRNGELTDCNMYRL